MSDQMGTSNVPKWLHTVLVTVAAVVLCSLWGYFGTLAGLPPMVISIGAVVLAAGVMARFLGPSN